eukprot:TRINITY_DN13231_c0_g1_i1.p1 TRINITY_DN13231_c0_g1~~TRINITY_DN13231_c0_g1_i1.p1  ORF type:complete len:196 (+),score=18.44 TRINITY_DN13231_c0_g1_i1:81-668(+)
MCIRDSSDSELKNISFVLIDQEKGIYVREEKEIAISKGEIASSKNILTECMHRYPTLSTRCNITFTRKSTDPIKMIVLYGELINPTHIYSHLPIGTCSLNVEGMQSTCVYDELGRVFITTFTPITNSSLKIIDLEYINPEGSERDNKKFSMRTFSTELLSPQSVVDRCDHCFTALVDCNYPVSYTHLTLPTICSV